MASRNTRQLLSDDTLNRLALEFEVGFFEAVIRGEPDHIGALEALGNAYTRIGRIEDGLRIDRRLVRLLPHNAVAHYNLACSLSLAGEVEEALDALERAIRLGYSDFEYLERDPDLANVRQHRRYRVLIRRD